MHRIPDSRYWRVIRLEVAEEKLEFLNLTEFEAFSAGKIFY